jgi:hypothetical protein
VRRSDTIKQSAVGDGFKRVEGYHLPRIDIYSLEEKRRAIPKGIAVVKKNGIRKLVTKREVHGERPYESRASLLGTEKELHLGCSKA